MKLSLKKLVFTATLLALAIVLDLLITTIPGLNLELPFGGKIFNLGILPLILMGLFLGIPYGLIGGIIFALFKFSLDYTIFLSTLKDLLESYTGNTWTTGHILLLIALDYLIPFGAFSLSGLFKKDNFKTIKNITFAVLLTSSIWLLSGTLSGVLLWGDSIKYAASSGEINLATNIFKFVNNNLFLYSLLYNSVYILTSSLLIYFILITTRKNLIILHEQTLSN